jgi:hypothetical protein
MVGFFRSLLDRAKAALALRAVEELEADVEADPAGRRAGLLPLADAYEAAGWPGAAPDLRRRAGEAKPRPVGPAVPPALPPPGVSGGPDEPTSPAETGPVPAALPPVRRSRRKRPV